YFGNQASYGVAITQGVWSHVAVVMRNGQATIYLNGQDNGTIALPTSAGVGPFTVGGVSGAGFSGLIDEVRVFTFGSGQFDPSDLLVNSMRVVTLAATGVGGTNATLNGSASALGDPLSAWFEWGTTTNYGNVTPIQAFGSGIISTNFNSRL